MPPATYLDDHRPPDVEDMLGKVVEEAERQDEAERDRYEPLPYDPDQLHAAKDLPRPSKGQWFRGEQDWDAEAGDSAGPEVGA